ncbi:MAG: antibiotic biosynthesis monooxygenase [Alphaproteobacteria bacterium]
MPHYAVIFISTRNDMNDASYDALAKKMDELSRTQEGYLGIESVRNADGHGITVSYWSSLEALKKWKAHKDHLTAQSLGKSRWYKDYKIQICRIDEEREMPQA